ncbi:MAG: T9SS type A sorting domain-containing protein [Flavobacteriales bacterium]|jgi:plastocyanin|nr:T9SS type A sorting domain-containing protein [Flavobacteriales bacterium]MBT6174538.1 T9SS type A sorting domain-containing protein [Flavobacteriales bacterium]
MKYILLLIGLTVIASISFAQQSMNISHQGTNPISITVQVGEDITFIYGGGGAHPMTEGWQDGSASTPEPFATQTVTSSNPTTTFQMSVPGHYVFHCNTNPGNQNNWGTIIVDGEISGVEEASASNLKVFPNPAQDIIKIDGNTEGTAVITDINGKIVMSDFTTSAIISELSRGTYFIKKDGTSTIFIKQ